MNLGVGFRAYGLGFDEFDCRFRGRLRIVSTPNLRPFRHYSLYNLPFRVRSGEVTLNCPNLGVGLGFAWIRDRLGFGIMQG